MRALVYTAVRSVEMQEWREPEPGNNEVLVRVRAAAICGSDVHGFLGYSKIRVPPMVMGHEFTGEILALGSGVSELAVGDRVVVQPLVTCMRCPACLSGRTNICQDRKLLGGHLQGGFAERIVAPRHLVYRLPDHVSYEAGSLTEPLANAVHMARLAPPAFADVASIWRRYPWTGRVTGLPRCRRASCGGTGHRSRSSGRRLPTRCRRGR